MIDICHINTMGYHEFGENFQNPGGPSSSLEFLIRNAAPPPYFTNKAASTDDLASLYHLTLDLLIQDDAL